MSEFPLSAFVFAALILYGLYLARVTRAGSVKNATP